MDSIYFLLVVVFTLIAFSYRIYNADKRDLFLLRLAMVFTVAADFCMLILYENLPGLCFFCVVQYIYHFRYTDRKRALFLSALILFLFIILSVSRLSMLYRISGLYALCLLFSVSGAVLAFRKKKYPFPNNYIVLGGMLLFLCCDICVMFYNLELPVDVCGVFQRLIWVFYLPSQLLLSISARKLS